MGNMKTKRVLPVPEYMKIRRYVVNRLFRLKKEDDLRMPSLQEMMRMFGVSRPTVRKAMKNLVQEGYLVSKHGIGMFANPKYLSENTDLRSKRLVIGILIGDGMIVHLDSYYALILSEILYEVAKRPALAHELQLPGISEDKVFDYLKNEQLDAILWVHPEQKYVPVIQKFRDSGFPIAVMHAGSPRVNADVSFDMKGLGQSIGKILVKENRMNVLYLGRKSVESAPFEGIRSVFEEKNLSCDGLHFLEIDAGTKKKIVDSLKKENISAIVNLFLPYEVLMELLESSGIDLKKQCLLIQNGMELPGDAFTEGIRFDFPIREAVVDLFSRVVSEESKEPLSLPFRIARFHDGKRI